MRLCRIPAAWDRAGLQESAAARTIFSVRLRDADVRHPHTREFVRYKIHCSRYRGIHTSYIRAPHRQRRPCAGGAAKPRQNGSHTARARFTRAWPNVKLADREGVGVVCFVVCLTTFTSLQVFCGEEPATRRGLAGARLARDVPWPACHCFSMCTRVSGRSVTLVALPANPPVVEEWRKTRQARPRWPETSTICWPIYLSPS